MLPILCRKKMALGEREYAYTALIHPVPPLGFVSFIIFHESLHQVLGPL